MKINMKKLVSVVLICGLSTSQIACAGKVTKISAPLEQVKFEKDYKYTVKLKTGEQTKPVSGDQIQPQSLMSQDVQRIDGVSTVKNGTYALRGLGNGAMIGGGAGLIIGIAAAIGAHGGGPVPCDGPDDDCDFTGWYILTTAALAGMGATIGGVLGLGIGALTPKYNKVQITPVISPTTSGVDAGVNVGVTF